MNNWIEEGGLVSIFFDKYLEGFFKSIEVNLNQVSHAKVIVCDETDYLPYELQIYDKENNMICEFWANKSHVEEIKNNNNEF